MGSNSSEAPGVAEREKAIDMAEEGGRGWVEEVGLPALRRVAWDSYAHRDGTIQTCELQHLIETEGLPRPAEKRVYGAVIRAATKQGWLSPTNTHVPARVASVAKRNHRRPMRVHQVDYYVLARTK